MNSRGIKVSCGQGAGRRQLLLDGAVPPLAGRHPAALWRQDTRTTPRLAGQHCAVSPPPSSYFSFFFFFLFITPDLQVEQEGRSTVVFRVYSVLIVRRGQASVAGRGITRPAAPRERPPPHPEPRREPGITQTPCPNPVLTTWVDRLRVGTARAEDAQGIPTQSHITKYTSIRR